MLNIKFLPAFLLIPFFSFGFLVSCDSVSGAEKDEKSEYINSITSEDFQSAEEQKLVDNYSVPEDGFYTCGSYDKKILDAIYKYRKQKGLASIMCYDSDLHKICIEHSKKWQTKSRFLI